MSTATNPAHLSAKVRQEIARAGEDIIAKLSEHNDPALTRSTVESALGVGKVAQAIEIERTRRTARSTLDREEAEADLRLPPQRDDYSLGAYLDEPRPARVERVENLQRASHRTLLVASYKTGKTTLHANLTRALTDGTPFLGKFAVERPSGRVGIWNAEMEAEDFADYLTNAGVTQNDRVAIWNLRGYRLPLTSDAAAQAAVTWLRDNDVKYWIIDPWARICSWSGADENVNAEVGPLLQRVDEIANDAGVDEVLIVHHAGHVKGRPRGATVLPDWADGIWLYNRDEDSDRRYLKAEGRGVSLNEGLIEIDEHGHTVYREVSRKAGKVNALIEDVVAFVAGNPGATTSEVQDTLTANNSLKTAAVRKAIDLGKIREERDPDDGRRKLLYFVTSGGGMEL